jgi:hypothetical protein
MPLILFGPMIGLIRVQDSNQQHTTAVNNPVINSHPSKLMLTILIRIPRFTTRVSVRISNIPTGTVTV